MLRQKEMLTMVLVTGQGPTTELTTMITTVILSYQFLLSHQQDFGHVAQSRRYEFIREDREREKGTLSRERVGPLRENAIAPFLPFSFIGGAREVSRVLPKFTS